MIKEIIFSKNTSGYVDIDAVQYHEHKLLF